MCRLLPSDFGQDYSKILTGTGSSILHLFMNHLVTLEATERKIWFRISILVRIGTWWAGTPFTRGRITARFGIKNARESHIPWECNNSPRRAHGPSNGAWGKHQCIGSLLLCQFFLALFHFIFSLLPTGVLTKYFPNCLSLWFTSSLLNLHSSSLSSLSFL